MSRKGEISTDKQSEYTDVDPNFGYTGSNKISVGPDNIDLIPEIQDPKNVNFIISPEIK